jgi:GTP-binding protein YchF
MKLGIIGPPQSGKTTIFNAVSGQQEMVGDYSRAVHRAVIKVPDKRLDDLASLINPRKITYAEIEFLDAAGFTGKGKSAGKDIDITPDLRLMDALVIVVDQFSPNAMPEKDYQSILDEMLIADLIVIENNTGKLEREIQLTGKKERALELDVLKKCQDALNNETMLSEIGLTPEEEKSIRGYAFLTLKPILLTFNISEDLLPEYESVYASYEKFCRERIRDISVICGKIEMELAALDEDDKWEFLKELNIARPATEKFILKSYQLLGMISFFTMNENECRASTIKKGSNAVQAAGAVHTDFARGFIKAEVATHEDFMEHETLSNLKATAKLHIEGKEYIVQDGDVILFRFNV